LEWVIPVVIIKQAAQMRSNIVVTGSPQDESVRCANLWPVNGRGIDCDYWTAHRAVAKGTAAQNFYTPSALFSGARAGGNGEF